MNAIIVLVGSAGDMRAVRAMFAREVAEGDPRTPETFQRVECLVLPAIGGHSLPFAANFKRGGLDTAQDAPMVHRAAAAALGVSVTTVGRRLRAGLLERDGRRITAASVRRLLEKGC